MLDFVLLGTSGMCPLPTRALSSCFVRIGEKSFLIDCGEGTQIELMRNKISTCDIDYILITHLHADHISGLMGVMLAMQMQGRNKELNIIGPRGLLKYITGFSMFIKGLEFKYNVVEKERPEKMRIKTKMSDIILDMTVCEHSVYCYAYSIELKRKKKFNVEKEELKELPMRFRSNLVNGEDVVYNGKTYYSKDFLLPAPKGCKFSIVTDTRPNMRLRKFVENSDLAVIEGMYMDDSEKEKAVRKRHMIWSESIGLVKCNNIGKFILTHFSPSLQIPEGTNKILQEQYPNGVIGIDGYRYHLDYPSDEIGVLDEIKKLNEDSITERIILERMKWIKDYYFYKFGYDNILRISPITKFKYEVVLKNNMANFVFLYKSPKSMKFSYDNHTVLKNGFNLYESELFKLS